MKHTEYNSLQDIVLNLPKERQNRLSLPPLLILLIYTGRWRQPSDELIAELIPFLLEPVDFLLDEWSIRFESQGQLADSARISLLFHEYRSTNGIYLDLPWIDVDRHLMIAVNRVIGDDVGIALDYRTSQDDPRVVASDWRTGDNTHHWREVFPTFSAFIEALRL